MMIIKNGLQVFIIVAIAVLLLKNTVLQAQETTISVSGKVLNEKASTPIDFVNIVLLSPKDSTFVVGTLTDTFGNYTLTGVRPGNYLLQAAFFGFTTSSSQVYVGSSSPYLTMKTISLVEEKTALSEVIINGRQTGVGNSLDKKSYTLADNIAQQGGSVLQTLQNLPGVTVQDSKVQLRGSDKISILIDGKQTALTGFGSQAGLDNIAASAIERIEIINNPSAKYDANGNAGIINIIMKKSNQNGFSGKMGVSSGLGALWVRKQNLPSIRPQYNLTPKLNPTLAFNYRKDKVNMFLQADNLYTQMLNKNEFVTRKYEDGTIVNSQLKRNRSTNFFTGKLGMDYKINDRNTLSVSAMYGNEKIIDRGDQPFFNQDYSARRRLWQFLEDELKTTVMATAAYQHRFSQPGHLLTIGFNYTFHREDEQYFYDNFLVISSGADAFKLLSDEKVYDINIDYTKPLKYGRLETGIKLRNRIIPTNMNFKPGSNSVIDASAGGAATYQELIPAVYGNYVLETQKWEAELGLRMEYVKIQYDVNPDHNTYNSDGYSYIQPFPNFRLTHNLDADNRFSLFFNRRVDRPNEVDIRIFPKYDDAEIVKVGNPSLRPQFTNSLELGYKHTWQVGYLYAAAYHRFANGTITRISSTVPGSTIIYAIFQNSGRSFNTGLEMVYQQEVSETYSFNVNGNVYRNQINAFAVQNLYPTPNTFSAAQQNAYSGNLKWNNNLRFKKGWNAQLTAVYLAPDIIPQGQISARFSIDAGIKNLCKRARGSCL